jgi:integrase
VRLTDKTIPALAIPEGRSEAIFFDDEVLGFGLRLRAGGGRVWIFQYKTASKHRRITIGSAKAISARKARETAVELYAKVKLKQDPAGDAREGLARAAETMGAVLGRYLLVKKARLKPRSYVEVERHLLANCKPLHSQQLNKITRRDIAVRLSEIEGTSGPVTRDRVRASLSAFFAWLIREGLADANPVAGTSQASGDLRRDRVLSDDELRAIWISLVEGQYASIVRLLILTGQRREEIGGLRWSEVDLDHGVVTIAAERTKNKRPHRIPLTAAARAIIEAQPRRLGRDMIFGEGLGSFSGWGAAKTALDARIAGSALADAVPALAPWRLHDIRRTAATRMADLGVQPHVIEAVLNHVSGHKAGVAGVYNRSSYDREVNAALGLWDDHVTSLVTGQARKVIPMRGSHQVPG